MKQRQIIIVGGTAAGPSAAAKAKRTNPNAEITLFEATDTVSYGICESPYAISGVIEDENKLVIYSPEKLQEEKGITVKTLHQVEKIIPTKHKIIVRDLRNHTTGEYEYDKLILAVGSQPKRLNVDGEDGRNVFFLKSRENTVNILNYLKSETPKQAVIIGGGYIGMELAEALRLRGLDATMVHQFSLPMEGLEQETRERVLEELQNNGVHFVTNAKVEALQLDKTGKVKHVITNRGSFETDIVLLSLGVSPNIEIAKTAKIRIGQNGAILTDERQQTSIEDVYAAGDCCEVKNIVTGNPMYLPLASIASRAGRVAGENAAGGRATFKGALRAMAVKIFNLQVAQVGISSEEAKRYGFKVVTEQIHGPSRNELMPGSEDLTVKLIIDQRTKRLLGANLFSCCGAVLRANTLAVAIQHKMTIDDIARWDLIYAPPFAPLWDPILVAANKAKKKYEP